MMAKSGPPGPHVVKVQIALSGATQARGLVYAEGRIGMREQLLPARVRDLVLARPNRKAYFTAILVGGLWEINDLTADQDW